MTFDKTIHLPVGADEAFALITEPERLRRWQTVAARVDLRIGGEYRWTVTPGHHAAGTFQEIEPGKRIVFTWGWESGMDLAPGASTVTITLEPDEDGTTLHLVHAGLTAEQAAAHAEGWNHYLDRLIAETSSPAGAGPDEWSAAPDAIDHISSAEASLAVLLGVLRKLTPEDREKATPCENFTAHELLEHLAGSLKQIGGALGANVSDDAGAGPEVRIAGLAQATLEAFSRRGFEGTIDMGFAAQGTPALAFALQKAQGDTVTYWQRSVETGAKELAKGHNAASHILTNARECSNSIAKSTGLMRDTIRIEATVSTADDYADLSDLALDADVVSIVDALEAAPDGTIERTEAPGEGVDPGPGHVGMGEAHPVPAEESDLVDPESGSATEPSSDAIPAP